MFGGILAKVLGVGLVLALLGNGFFYLKGKWQASAYEKQIRELQDVAIKLRADVFRKGAEIADLRAVKKYRERKAHENQEIDQVVTAGDDSRMRSVFIDLGMLPGTDKGDAKLGPKGSPGN